MSPFQFQSAPSARGATPLRNAGHRILGVSIRALSAGGDCRLGDSPSQQLCFNPRPQRGGRRAIGSRTTRKKGFNPRPQRGGRPWRAGATGRSGCFNPRPQRGGRRDTQPTRRSPGCFNPRPQRGGRRDERKRTRELAKFQSAPSARGATIRGKGAQTVLVVSIRALSAGGDGMEVDLVPRCSSFNPRPQRGGRRGDTAEAAERSIETVSIRALSAGGDSSGKPLQRAGMVSIRALSAGGDPADGCGNRRSCRFNPRPQRGGRPSSQWRQVENTLFQSAPSARGATRRTRCYVRRKRFQSAPSARGATPLDDRVGLLDRVSIRALSAGGDRRCRTGFGFDMVSIRALSAGGDREIGHLRLSISRFNPRPQRGGRPGGDTAGLAAIAFQSAPSARGATRQLARNSILSRFQSAPSARGATIRFRTERLTLTVSIRALSAGGDVRSWYGLAARSRFNPRPQRGGRLAVRCLEEAASMFQSAPSARGATRRLVDQQQARIVSIRALSAGGDPATTARTRCAPVSIRALSAGGDPAARGGLHSIRGFNPRPQRGGRPSRGPRVPVPGCFNPRPQRGGRPYLPPSKGSFGEFQSAPSARGATLGCLALAHLHWVSIRALSAGGDASPSARVPGRPCFNPRPQRGGRLSNSGAVAGG